MQTTRDLPEDFKTDELKAAIEELGHRRRQPPIWSKLLFEYLTSRMCATRFAQRVVLDPKQDFPLHVVDLTTGPGLEPADLCERRP